MPVPAGHLPEPPSPSTAWSCAVGLLLLATLCSAALRAQPPNGTPAEDAALLVRTGATVASAVETLGSVVCEERYVQTLLKQGVLLGTGSARPVVDSTTRTLVSDYLLVHFPDARGWVPFRDVYSVDGTPVRDRENRLLALFVDPHADRLLQADEIRRESARYNLGSGTYDINVPTFALQFLLPELQPRFRFTRAHDERLDGIVAAVVEYEEQARPTVIRGAGSDDDVPAWGRVWVEPGDGQVLQTRLETGSRGKQTRIDVRFGRDRKLGVWVPVEMHERHGVAGESLEARASYANCRRFQVNTVEQVQDH